MWNRCTLDLVAQRREGPLGRLGRDRAARSEQPTPAPGRIERPVIGGYGSLGPVLQVAFLVDASDHGAREAREPFGQRGIPGRRGVP